MSRMYLPRALPKLPDRAQPHMRPSPAAALCAKRAEHVGWHSKADAATCSAYQAIPAVRAAGVQSGGEDALDELRAPDRHAQSDEAASCRLAAISALPSGSQRFHAWWCWPPARTKESSLAEIFRMLLDRARDTMEPGSGTSWKCDKVRVIREGSRYPPDSRRPCAATKAS